MQVASSGSKIPSQTKKKRATIANELTAQRFGVEDSSQAGESKSTLFYSKPPNNHVVHFVCHTIGKLGRAHQERQKEKKNTRRLSLISSIHLDNPRRRCFRLVRGKPCFKHLAAQLTSPSIPFRRPALGTTASSLKPKPRQSRRDASLLRNTCGVTQQKQS